MKHFTFFYSFLYQFFSIPVYLTLFFAMLFPTPDTHGSSLAIVLMISVALCSVKCWETYSQVSRESGQW